jgi:gamma-glutamyltranspeptidase / glutathione hydrolase
MRYIVGGRGVRPTPTLAKMGGWGWLLLLACDRPLATESPAVARSSPTLPTESAPSAQPALAEPPRAAANEPPPLPELGIARLPATLERLHIEGPVTSTSGVVTSVESQATRVGVEILNRGGNAVDAAVATALALAVTHPSAGNLAGGGFALVRMGASPFALDFREQSPAALTDASFYRMLKAEAKTGAAVGVPGTVAGLLLLQERFGRLKREDVVAPAERLANDGYVQGERQSSAVRWARADLERNPNARRAFFELGQVRPAGSRIRRPDLGLALKRIREQGKAGFYEGPTATDIVTSLGPEGLLTLEDLRAYGAEWRTPLGLDYRGIQLLTMPPPSAGGPALLTLLSILSTVELRPADDARTLHYFAEASRRAQLERRLFVAAPGRWSDERKAALESRWTDSKTWLEAHPIDPLRATPSADLYAQPVAAETESEHTTHLATVDADGNVVSLTLTLSASFGTRIFTRETGMALNNSVASFSSSGENTPQANVRTVSSMAPTLLVAGDETVALGSPGGDTIPSTIALTVVGLVDFQGGFAPVVKAPRIHQGLFPDRIETERSHPLPKSVLLALERQGHQVLPKRFAQGDANLAAWISRKAHAISDSREGGLALGASVARPSAPRPSAPGPSQDSDAESTN